MFYFVIFLKLCSFRRVCYAYEGLFEVELVAPQLLGRVVSIG